MINVTEQAIKDVIIIGGGPVGMFAAYYAGLRELSAQIIEALPVLGGQVEMLYLEKSVYDIGGIPGISGKALVKNLKKQMDIFPPEITLDNPVKNITKKDDIFHVETDRGTFLSRTILITTGQGSFAPRKLPLTEAEHYEDKNLHYYVKNIDQFRDKRVTILGGGDSAVEWALMLEDVAKQVTLVHRRNQFRAHEALASDLKKSSVKILTPYMPDELIGDDNGIQALKVKERRGDDTLEVPLDELIVSFGFAYSSRELSQWGLEVKQGQMVVDSTMQSSIPGIYGAGDVTMYDGKVKLIAVGFGEAPVAISAIAAYLDPSIKTIAPRNSELILRAQKGN